MASREFVKQRRKSIVQLLKKTGSIPINRLANFFSVSTITIRRDLDILQKAGYVNHTYGIATFNCNYAKQTGCEYISIKKLISRTAADLIQDEDIVLLNSSSTALGIMDYIHSSNVTIITNNGMILEKDYSRDISVILTGGEVRPLKHSLTGDFTLSMLSQIRATKCIMGCDGFSAKAGLTTHNPNEMQVNKIMLERSDQRIVVADHRKLGNIANFSYGNIGQIDILITDRGLEKKLLDQFYEMGLKKILLVSPTKAK